MDDADAVDENASNPMTGFDEGLEVEEVEQHHQPARPAAASTTTTTGSTNFERAIYIVFNLDTSGFSIDNNKITKIESKSLDYKGKLLNGFNFSSIVDEKQYQPFSVVGKDFMNNVLDSIAYIEEEYYNSSTNVEHIIFVTHCSRNYDVCFLFHQLNKNGLHWPEETVDKLYKLDTKQLAIQAIKEQNLDPGPSNFQLQGLYNFCTDGKKELVYGKDRVDAIVKILTYSKFWMYRLNLIGPMEAKPVIIPTVHKLVRAPGSVRHTCVYCALFNIKIGHKKTRTRFQCCVPTCNLPLCNNSVPTGNYIDDMFDPTSDDAIDCFKLAHANKDTHQQCLDKFLAMQKATNKRYRNSLVKIDPPLRERIKKKKQTSLTSNDDNNDDTTNDINNNIDNTTTTPNDDDNNNNNITSTPTATSTAKKRGRPKKNSITTSTPATPKHRRPKKKKGVSDDTDNNYDDIPIDTNDELQYV